MRTAIQASFLGPAHILIFSTHKDVWIVMMAWYSVKFCNNFAQSSCVPCVLSRKRHNHTTSVFRFFCCIAPHSTGLVLANRNLHYGFQCPPKYPENTSVLFFAYMSMMSYCMSRIASAWHVELRTWRPRVR